MWARFQRRLMPFRLGDTYGFTRRGTMIRWYRTNTGHPRVAVSRNMDAVIPPIPIRTPKISPIPLAYAAIAFGCGMVLWGQFARPSFFGSLLVAFNFTCVGCLIGQRIAFRQLKKGR